MRYYHSLIDKSIFKSGQPYANLEKVVVIFITTYDPFGYDRMLYTVKRQCVEEPDMPYEDGDYTYFLYVYGTKDIPSQDLQDMLLFLAESTEENAKSEDLKAVLAMMDEIKQDSQVEVRHMIAMEHDRDILIRGREEGREEGIVLTKKVLRLDREGYAVSEIAAELNVREEDVRKILEE